MAIAIIATTAVADMMISGEDTARSAFMLIS
jgi:hypothetical protein